MAFVFFETMVVPRHFFSCFLRIFMNTIFPECINIQFFEIFLKIFFCVKGSQLPVQRLAINNVGDGYFITCYLMMAFFTPPVQYRAMIQGSGANRAVEYFTGILNRVGYCRYPSGESSHIWQHQQTNNFIAHPFSNSTLLHPFAYIY